MTHRTSTEGFTLLEMLIALSILAMIATAITLNLGATHARDGDALVHRLEFRLQYATDDALVTGRPIAFVSDEETGYRFLDWNPAHNRWESHVGPELTNEGAAGRALKFTGLGPNNALEFRPSGLGEGFSLTVGLGSEVWRLNSDGINVWRVDGGAE